MMISAGVCAMLTGCFSYTKESTTRTTPSVAVPSESSSTTTTTTDTGDGVVERQHTTTVTNP
jgi:hypothetical protein